RAAASARGVAGPRRTQGLRARLPAPALGRDATARLDRPRAGNRAADLADGRAVRRAGRDHARPPEPGAAADLGGDRHHDRLRAPVPSRSRLSRGPRLRLPAAAGPGGGRSPHRSAVATRPGDEGHAAVPPTHCGAAPRARSGRMTAPARQGRSAGVVLARRIVLPLVVIAGLVIVWDVMIRILAIPPYVVPSPAPGGQALGKERAPLPGHAIP